MMRDKDFSNIISERFEGHGETPSDDVWSNIESNLDQDKKRRRIIIWWSIAALFAISAIAVTFISNGEKETLTSSSSSESSTDKSTIDNTQDQQKDIEKSNPEKSTENVAVIDNSKNNSDSQKHSSDVDKNDSKKSDNLISPKLDPKPKDRLVEEKKDDPVLALTSNPTEEDDKLLEILPLDEILIGRINDIRAEDSASYHQIVTPSWRLGVKASMFLNSTKPTADPVKSDSISSVYNAPPPAPEEFEDITHRRFFEVEAFAKYSLNNRFRLGSGIMFSMGYDGQRLDTVIYGTKRYTFGIPLELQFRIVNRNRFQLSTSVSLINEYARVSTTTAFSSSNADNQDPGGTIQGGAITSYVAPENFRANHYAFGIQGSIGATYNIGSRFSLFAEVGYRNYLIEKYSFDFQYVKNPNYFNTSLGAIWTIKHRKN